MENNTDTHNNNSFPLDGASKDGLVGEEKKATTTSVNAPAQTNQVRSLGRPLDTVSGATQELFEVRSSGASSAGSDTVFKIIAIVAIVALVGAIIATQLGTL